MIHGKIPDKPLPKVSIFKSFSLFSIRFNSHVASSYQRGKSTMALSASSGVAPAISGGKSAGVASAGSDKGAIARRLQSELMAIMMVR